MVWIQPGGFSSTALSGHGVPVVEDDEDVGVVDARLVILAGVDLGVTVSLVDDGAAPVLDAGVEAPVDEAPEELKLPELDCKTQDPIRFIRSKSRLVFEVSNVSDI